MACSPLAYMLNGFFLYSTSFTGAAFCNMTYMSVPFCSSGAVYTPWSLYRNLLMLVFTPCDQAHFFFIGMGAGDFLLLIPFR